MKTTVQNVYTLTSSSIGRDLPGVRPHTGAQEPPRLYRPQVKDTRGLSKNTIVGNLKADKVVLLLVKTGCIRKHG